MVKILSMYYNRSLPARESLWLLGTIFYYQIHITKIIYRLAGHCQYERQFFSSCLYICSKVSMPKRLSDFCKMMATAETRLSLAAIN